MYISPNLIEKALTLIYDKTGIVFSSENVKVKELANFKKKINGGKAIIGGCYPVKGGDDVFVNPRLMTVNKYDYLMSYARRLREYDPDLVQLQPNGDYKILVTKSEYCEKAFQKQQEDVIRTVIHEVGHWVHCNYFHNKAMYIKCGSDYAKKNADENFAVAFEQYVLGETVNDPTRHKHIERILTSDLQNTRKWRLEHAS